MYSEKEKEVIHLQDSYTIMYALISRKIMEELGFEGERIVREATRRYGRDRGRTRREKHVRLGVKVNMLSLFSIASDLPGDPRFVRDKRLLIPEERNSHTLVCPMAEVWKQYNAQEIGRIYCEEFHRACYKEYGYGYTQVNLGQTLTEEGDPYCDFHVVLRKANVPVELRSKCFEECDKGYTAPDVSSVKDASAKGGFASLCIRVYYYMLEVLREQQPEKAEATMLKALELWAEDTAFRLKRDSSAEGVALTEEYREKNFPLYTNIDADPLFPKYDKYGAKDLLKKGFYEVLDRKLNESTI